MMLEQVLQYAAEYEALTGADSPSRKPHVAPATYDAPRTSARPMHAPAKEGRNPAKRTPTMQEINVSYINDWCWVARKTPVSDNSTREWSSYPAIIVTIHGILAGTAKPRGEY